MTPFGKSASVAMIAAALHSPPSFSEPAALSQPPEPAHTAPAFQTNIGARTLMVCTADDQKLAVFFAVSANYFLLSAAKAQNLRSTTENINKRVYDMLDHSLSPIKKISFEKISGLSTFSDFSTGLAKVMNDEINKPKSTQPSGVDSMLPLHVTSHVKALGRDVERCSLGHRRPA